MVTVALHKAEMIQLFNVDDDVDDEAMILIWDMGRSIVIDCIAIAIMRRCF